MSRLLRATLFRSDIGAMRESGDVAIGFITLATATGIALLFSTLMDSKTKTEQKQLRSTRLQLAVRYGAETTFQAYRRADSHYNRVVSSTPQCAGLSRTFSEALLYGSGCNSGDIMTFTASDWAKPDVFQYQGVGCTIHSGNRGSSCSQGKPELLLSVGSASDASVRVGFGYIEVYFTQSVPEKGVVDFQMVVNQNSSLISGTSVYSQDFGILDSYTNAAHLEVDGRVTEESIDPLAICPGGSWQNFQFYDPVAYTCKTFAQLGSGTGLAYYYTSSYGGRYFGFRPMDGSVIDLLSLGSGGSNTDYLVAEDGSIQSNGTTEVVFPRYNRAILTNVDDITLIQNQIYTVSGMGANAKISALIADSNVPPVWSLVPLCNLGAQGWAQSYVGISAPNWGDPINPESAFSYQQADFYLKTDSGDILLAQAQGPLAANGTPQAVDPTKDCFISKPQMKQKIEYKRTLGFERIGDERPYILY